MGQFTSSTNQGSPIELGLGLPKVTDEAVQLAVSELSSAREISRLSAAQFLAAQRTDMSDYSPAIIRALAREKSADVLIGLCNLVSVNNGILSQCAPHLVKLLAHYDQSVVARAAQVLASSPETAEAAYVPIWTKYFTGPQSDTVLPDIFLRSLQGSSYQFERSFREHVYFFVDSTLESQVEYLQEISMQGLERSDHQRAFFASALCHPFDEVRAAALRLLIRLNRKMDAVPEKARDMIESALAFTASHYLRPEVKPDDRFMYVFGCARLVGSASLSQILMSFASEVEPSEAISLMYEAALIAPDESAEEAINELARLLESRDSEAAALRLADLSARLPAQLQDRAVQALCLAVNKVVGESEPNAEELRHTSQMLGYAWGDDAAVVDFCGSLLGRFPGEASELAAASVLVRRIERISDQALLDRIHKMLLFLSTSSNEEVQKTVGFRRPSYPSGPITKGLR